MIVSAEEMKIRKQKNNHEVSKRLFDGMFGVWKEAFYPMPDNPKFSWMQWEMVAVKPSRSEADRFVQQNK